jgi:predicted small lipoprotein YifL
VRLSAVLAAGAALALAGCGQKGPLYLPDKNARVITTTPAPQPQSAPEQAPPTTPPAPKKNSEDGEPQTP